MDLTKSQVGRLCAETGMFMFTPHDFIKVALEALSIKLPDSVETNRALLHTKEQTLTQGQLGVFVIDAALGELEFEVEENEVTLNLNKAVTSEGEWGIFLPVAAAGGAGAGAVRIPSQ